MDTPTSAEKAIAARRLAAMRPVVAALAGVAAPEAFWELCRDELSGVDVAAGGWDIRARWFGVVICATPRLGELRPGITISWRIIAAMLVTFINNRTSDTSGSGTGIGEILRADPPVLGVSLLALFFLAALQGAQEADGGGAGAGVLGGGLV